MNKILFETISILTILNPLAAATMMLTLVKYSDIPNVSKKTSLSVFVSLFVVMLAGNFLIKIFGINIPAIKSIGGVILLIIAINMVQGKEIAPTNSTKEEKEIAEKLDDISIVPLTIPILVGPGVITTVIVFSQKANTIYLKTELFISIFISSVITYLVLRNAMYLSKYLGKTGLKIMSRIMGLIIGSIAFIFLVSGIKELWNLY